VVWRHGCGAGGDEVTSGALQVTLGVGCATARSEELVGLLAMTVGADEAGAAAGDDDAGIHGRSPPVARLREELRRIAPTDIAVLVLGETGAGKEVAAQAVHRLSERTGGFVPVNLAAIPKELVEAELFARCAGLHRRGAGAAGSGDSAHRGRCSDEIGDLDVAMQASCCGSSSPERCGRRVDGVPHR
jgi:transcriptional regulator with PAS, ATPase and Fis domain